MSMDDVGNLLTSDLVRHRGRIKYQVQVLFLASLSLVELLALKDGLLSQIRI